jgi:hypothetical protein
VPRWALLAWVWTALPISLVLSYRCDGTPLERVCLTASNSDAAEVWFLPTMAGAVAPSAAPEFLKLLAPLVFTVVCDLAIRRFSPPRPPAWTLLLLVVIWWLAGVLAFRGALMLAIR